MAFPVRLTLLGALVAAPVMAPAQAPEFLHALNNRPIEFTLRPDQEITPQVEAFHETGENPYVGDAEAIAAGQASYRRLCAACHLPDGSGRIGPNLIHGDWKYERTDTEVGRFEIIYAGGAGSMQAFGQRIDQDEILKIMAFLDSIYIGDREPE